MKKATSNPRHIPHWDECGCVFVRYMCKCLFSRNNYLHLKCVVKLIFFLTLKILHAKSNFFNVTVLSEQMKVKYLQNERTTLWCEMTKQMKNKMYFLIQKSVSEFFSLLCWTTRTVLRWLRCLRVCSAWRSSRGAIQTKQDLCSALCVVTGECEELAWPRVWCSDGWLVLEVLLV